MAVAPSGMARSVTAARGFAPVRKSTSESGALAKKVAVSAESIGKRPHRHAIKLASRRWRGGHASAVGGEARDRARTRRRLAERLAVAPEAHGRVQLEFIY